MQFKPFFYSALFVTISLLAGWIYLWQSAPSRIDANIKKIFAQHGFKNATFLKPDIDLKSITYKNISLDRDSFSTINELHVQFSYIPLFFRNKINTIKIDGLDVTGEFNNKGKITIAGLQNKSPNTNWLQFANLVEFSNARMSLLNDSLGGLTLSGDIQLQNTDDNRVLQARINAKQRQLSATAQIEGQMTAEGYWDTRIEIEQGKVNFGEIKTTRLTGLLNLSGRNAYISSIVGEVQSGGLNLLGMPWQNVAMTLNGNTDNPGLVLGAKALGHDDIELGITIENLHDHKNFTGQLHVENLSDALDYLSNNKILNMNNLPRGLYSFESSLIV